MRDEELEAALQRHRKLTVMMYVIAAVVGLVTVIGGVMFWVSFASGSGMGPT